MRLVKAIAVATALSAMASLSAVSAAEIKVGLAAPPSAIDPHFHNLSPNNSLLGHIFDRLVLQDPSQALIPGLAESWKAVDDTTWEFKLRKGVTFHDGSPFTADDVLCTFKRAPNVPNSPSSFGLYLKGKTAEKVDDHTVLIKTATPQPLVPNDLSTIYIVSKSAGCEAKTEDYNAGKAAVGTGPFKFAEYVPGDRIVMTANDKLLGRQAGLGQGHLQADHERAGARGGHTGRRRRRDRGRADRGHRQAVQGRPGEHLPDRLQPRDLFPPGPLPRDLALHHRQGRQRHQEPAARPAGAAGDLQGDQPRRHRRARDGRVRRSPPASCWPRSSSACRRS